jgi:LacI family transcriptional regulator
MAPRATIVDIAEAAGVSVATVDRVLNDRLPVRQQTALRVVEAAERIGYHAAGLLKQRIKEAPVRRLGFLLQKRDEFYRAFGDALVAETQAAPNATGKAIVEFNEEIGPTTIAERIREMAGKVDALAVVAVDHPEVNEAVEAAGIPIFTLLSDVTAPSRAGLLSADTRKAGRTAAWAITRLARQPGKIGILIGSHRYLSQEIAEIGLRTYVREHAPAFTTLEPIINLEDQNIAYAAVKELMRLNADLAGIYVAGGGAEGFVRALREAGPQKRIVGVCNELTPTTRQALTEDVIDLVLDTPIAQLAKSAVEAMLDAIAQPRPGVVQVLLPPTLYTSENI